MCIPYTGMYGVVYLKPHTKSGPLLSKALLDKVRRLLLLRKTTVESITNISEDLPVTVKVPSLFQDCSRLPNFQLPLSLLNWFHNWF
jgi:hypothetical protein